MPDSLTHYLLSRHPPTSPGLVSVRKDTEQLCRAFAESGLADRHFLTQLCSTNEASFWQRYSEARIADELLQSGYRLRSNNRGPDFLIEFDGRRTWIEVICPTPTDIPAEWLAPTPGVATKMPVDAITLRWTSAIKEKIEKLLGNEEKSISGYHRSGIVAPQDSYVIAVNGRMLRSDVPQLNGIGRVPFAAEIAFAIGPFQIRIDRKTLRAIGSGYAHRPIVLNRNQAPIHSCTFLDQANAAISAIWAVDLDEFRSIGTQQPMAVIHNPLASNPLPAQFLPADNEFFAVFDGERGVVVPRDGRRPIRETQ